MMQRSSLHAGNTAVAPPWRVLAVFAAAALVVVAALLLRGRFAWADTLAWILTAFLLAIAVWQILGENTRAAEERARATRLQHFTGRILERVGAASATRIVAEEGAHVVGAVVAGVILTRDGLEPDIVASYGFPPEDIAPQSDVYRHPLPIMDAIRTGEPVWIDDIGELRRRYPDLKPMVDAGRSWAALPLQFDTRRIGGIAFGFPFTGPFSADFRAFLQLVAQQSAPALERARLHDMELRARVRAEFAERRLALLAEASARVGASLDYLASLASLSQIVVPEVADWCIIHLLDDHDVPRLVAASHSDPALAARVRELEEQHVLSDKAAQVRALRTGEVIHVEDITPEYVRLAARDESHEAVLAEFGIRSLLAVPLFAEERVSGAITFANAQSGRRFTESDITLALELGRRAGNAVENARLYQAAHHASETKSDFLAVMSHELRTPLNAIIGYSDLLLMGVPDGVPERAHRQIERIRSASTSLLQLVEEVLSFSRIEAGKEEIRISPVDVVALLRECMAMIEPLAAEKGLTVQVDAGPPLKVVSDERKIRQILTNLLSNAVKFTEHGGVHLTAHATDGEVVIEVRDTGIGIAPENLERIFEPFWQVEQSATRRFGGTGLGLGVARKLARLLEGRLEVQSELGKGSVFMLTLPLHTPGMARLG